MRATTLVILIMALACGASAQDLPKAEIFGGYSLLHLDVPDDAISPSIVLPDVNLHGWRASLTTNFGNHFGLVVEGSGHYGTASSNETANHPTRFRQPQQDFCVSHLQ